MKKITFVFEMDDDVEVRVPTKVNEPKSNSEIYAAGEKAAKKLGWTFLYYEETSE